MKLQKIAQDLKDKKCKYHESMIEAVILDSSRKKQQITHADDIDSEE